MSRMQHWCKFQVTDKPRAESKVDLSPFLRAAGHSQMKNSTRKRPKLKASTENPITGPACSAPGVSLNNLASLLTLFSCAVSRCAESSCAAIESFPHKASTVDLRRPGSCECYQALALAMVTKSGLAPCTQRFSLHRSTCYFGCTACDRRAGYFPCVNCVLAPISATFACLSPLLQALWCFPIHNCLLLGAHCTYAIVSALGNLPFYRRVACYLRAPLPPHSTQPPLPPYLCSYCGFRVSMDAK